MTDERFYARQFIKVGNKVINPTQITDVDLESKNSKGEPCVRIFLVQSAPDEANQLAFDGVDAQALRLYFDGNSYDVLAYADEYEGMLAIHGVEREPTINGAPLAQDDLPF